ncbi:MAG: deoxyribodipyrimidine photo-lyase [marine bacterium B5-7]|nr:MAG: deoxyribodipyrimidine photo-lyase [marine bacterium B5-7]
MIDLIYLEREAIDHPRTQKILNQYPRAEVVECERYGELFNRSGQNFRLQKNRPALILAIKHGTKVLPAPQEYSVGGKNNYYFSHMLNCLYDCRYCFLQGIYRSANYVLYVNYEEFFDSIRGLAASAPPGDENWFFSGYDCDSLALEPLTGFVESVLPVFEELPSNWLELRTKSTQIRSLLSREPLSNVVVAFSFTTEPASRTLEHKVPNSERRMDALAALQRHGWPVALRFDPLIYHPNFKSEFAALCERIFSHLNSSLVHSVSVGGFRLPRDFYKRMRKLYPKEPLFIHCLEDNNGMVGYCAEIEADLLEAASNSIEQYVDKDSIYRIEEGAS